MTDDEAATPQASGAVAELVAWVREQIEATLMLPWHLRDCQMLTPVSGGLTRAIIGDTFSCNCALATAMFNQHQAHTAVLDAVQRGIAGHPGDCVNVIGDEPGHYDKYDSCALHIKWAKTALPPYAAHLVALAYQHRPGYQEAWRP